MKDQKILIIDDDDDLLQLTGILFKKEGAQVLTAHNGLDGMNQLYSQRPNLVILDVKMPGMNGFDVCERMRQITDTPIIILTALNGEQEMLRGLEAGADDFLSKPFNVNILLARAKAVLRRSENMNSQDSEFQYNDGHLSIDVWKHDVSIQGKRIKLTPVEFRLLVFLARNAGKVLTFEQIISNVWGAKYRGSTEYVHVYVSHLRKKLAENTRSPHYILTLHGVGYIFEK